MTTKDNGGDAFPMSTPTDIYPGMTLRDWFAGQAMAGLLAATAHPNSTGPAHLTDTEWAEKAFSLSDALIAERSK